MMANHLVFGGVNFSAGVFFVFILGFLFYAIGVVGIVAALAIARVGRKRYVNLHTGPSVGNGR